MRVIVAGGGIGGLTTAIALRHQGIEVVVLEQAEVLNEIGAGIRIASNAAIVLRELGLEPPRAPSASNPNPTTIAICAHRAPALSDAAGR
jgi:2-polyprenyl-6-methoxyphenol hydroxylase-like FAD-dependent oxidoreductase